ncbi:hypothetical protein [Pseudarthrobacter sulfonivorans]|uniref:hypothetical protein n=1 Tax=Pseudarthrobacter sulfonivorans TaxID=121292 RepID=UPI00210392F7|nr:hypothetical protein [Pseudarthrobacter sulfonivorans]
MTLLTERTATSSASETTLKTAAWNSAADTTVRGGSYVSVPADGVYVEGGYVTAPGNPSPVTRGSYVTVDGAALVAARVIEGSYVTLPTAA